MTHWLVAEDAPRRSVAVRTPSLKERTERQTYSNVFFLFVFADYLYFILSVPMCIFVIIGSLTSKTPHDPASVRLSFCTFIRPYFDLQVDLLAASVAADF